MSTPPDLEALARFTTWEQFKAAHAEGVPLALRRKATCSKRRLARTAKQPEKPPIPRAAAMGQRETGHLSVRMQA